MKQIVTFDPLNPVCPHCNAALTAETKVDTKRYEAAKLTLHIHHCTCNNITGYVIADNHQAGEPYTMQHSTFQPAPAKRKWRIF